MLQELWIRKEEQYEIDSIIDVLSWKGEEKDKQTEELDSSTDKFNFNDSVSFTDLNKQSRSQVDVKRLNSVKNVNSKHTIRSLLQEIQSPMFDSSFEYNRKHSGDNTGTAPYTDERKQKLIESLNGVIQPKSLKRSMSSTVKISKKNKSEGHNSLEFDKSYDQEVSLGRGSKNQNLSLDKSLSNSSNAKLTKSISKSKGSRSRKRNKGDGK